MRDTRYLSHAWALLTRDRGWPMVVLMLFSCAFVPVVGWAFALGYEVEWACLIARGLEEPPGQRDIDAGRCLRSGCRSLVVALGWCVACAALFLLAMTVTGGSLPSAPPHDPREDDLWIFSLSFLAAQAAGSTTFWLLVASGSLCATLAVVAGVWAAVCRSVAAGFRVARIMGMVRSDVGGYIGISSVAVFVFLVLFALLPVFFFLLGVAAFSSLFVGWDCISMTDLAFRLLVVMACTLMSLMLHAMVGLWLRQFDIPLGGANGALSLMASQSQDRPWRVAPPRSATLRRGAHPFPRTQSSSPSRHSRHHLPTDGRRGPAGGWGRRRARAQSRYQPMAADGAKTTLNPANRAGASMSVRPSPPSGGASVTVGLIWG